MSMESLSNCLYFEKDPASNYKAISPYYVRGLGFNNPHEMIGRSDYDSLSPISKMADLLVAEDQEILKYQRPIIYVKSLLFHGDVQPRVFITEKAPIFDEHQNACGIRGVGIEMPTNHPLINILLTWSKEFINQAPTQFSFKITSYKQSKQKFSRRETQCLHLLLRGKSAKEIARHLNISAKTVESHIEKIKFKMKVHTRSQLIENCILHGFEQIIPFAHQ